MADETFESRMEEKLESASRKLTELEKMAESSEAGEQLGEEIKAEIRRLRNKEEEFREEFDRHKKGLDTVWKMMDELVSRTANEFIDSVESLGERIKNLKNNHSE
jgi:hypothetical protein